MKQYSVEVIEELRKIFYEENYNKEYSFWGFVCLLEINGKI